MTKIGGWLHDELNKVASFVIWIVVVEKPSTTGKNLERMSPQKLAIVVGESMAL